MEEIKCSNSNCKNKRIIPNIIFKSYLYPKEYGEWKVTGDKRCWLYCSICKNESGNNGCWLVCHDLEFDTEKGEFNKIIDTEDLTKQHKNCPQVPDNNNLIYDTEYILEQLNKGYKKALDTNGQQGISYSSH